MVEDEIAGHAMYAVEAPGGREAEVAVVVEDGRRSKGLGGLLLSEIVEEARRDGVRVLSGSPLGDNYDAFRLARRILPRSRASYISGTRVIRASLASPPAQEEADREVPGKQAHKRRRA